MTLGGNCHAWSHRDGRCRRAAECLGPAEQRTTESISAGVDSKAREQAPSGAVNQGPFDPTTWKYGSAFNPPAGSKIWNPVKIKLMAGGKVTGGTVFSATDPATYCAMANAGYDFIWTEMQHN